MIIVTALQYLFCYFIFFIKFIIYFNLFNCNKKFNLNINNYFNSTKHFINFDKSLIYKNDNYLSMNEIKNNNLISSIKKNLLKKVYYNIIFVFKGFYYNYKKNIFYVENKKYFKYTKNNLKIKNKNKNFLTKRFMKIPTFKKFRISSYFDLNRIHPITKQISPHFGIDFATPAGTPVLAVGDGEILVSKKDKIAGNYITINHGYKCFTKYMHLKKIFVKRGQKVKKGEKIALSGNTGRSTGPHLHFEIWIDKIAINPMKI